MSRAGIMPQDRNSVWVATAAGRAVMSRDAALRLADDIRAACGVPTHPRPLASLCGLSWRSAGLVAQASGCVHSCTRVAGHDRVAVDDELRIGKMIHICVCSQTFAGGSLDGVRSVDTVSTEGNPDSEPART